MGQTLTISNKATSAKGASSCIAHREDGHKKAGVVACQKMLELLLGKSRPECCGIVGVCWWVNIVC